MKHNINTKTRYQICLDLAKCIYNEIQVEVHIHFTGTSIYAELPYLPPIYPTAIGTRLNNYLKNAFGLSMPALDFNEHKQMDDSWVRALCYEVDEAKWQEIQTLLRMKGY